LQEKNENNFPLRNTPKKSLRFSAGGGMVSTPTAWFVCLSADEMNSTKENFVRRFLFWATGCGVTSPRELITCLKNQPPRLLVEIPIGEGQQSRRPKSFSPINALSTAQKQKRKIPTPNVESDFALLLRGFRNDQNLIQTARLSTPGADFNG
jgi:hypothetical protein